MNAAGLTIGLAWRQVRDRFRAAGLDTPDLDARLLAQAALGLDAMALVRREREAVAPEGVARLERFAVRRLGGEPVSRILGRREFWGLAFELSPATLDPRPETEMLVTEGLAALAAVEKPRFVDLGTGSGAIAVAIAASNPAASGIATDVSPDALIAAERNARRHDVAARLRFLAGSWWQAVPDGEVFDLIVSNPPYIAGAEIDRLAPEVRLHDPRAALDGGWDGLEAYRAIAGQAVRRLRKNGVLALEIGATQAEVLGKILSRAGLQRIEVQKDLAGLDRVILASHS